MTGNAQIFAPLCCKANNEFGMLFPDHAGTFAHGLVGHPLLSPEALAEAAMRMPSHSVEFRIADAPAGGEFAHQERAGRTIADVIASLPRQPGWVMLRNPEVLPEWVPVLEQLTQAVRATVPDIILPQIFVFLSSPRAHTPAHFDPEHNILFQIAGSKVFSVCPQGSAAMTADVNARYHATGDNMLPWDACLQGTDTPYRLAPGQALYVPYKSPHWVDVGKEMSISLSFTWKTPVDVEQEYAWSLNARLKRWGVDLAPPGKGTLGTAIRARAHRVLERVAR